MHAQLEWPDFRIPPINLWVMPGWGGESTGEPHAHPVTQHLRKLINEHQRLLAIRGGNHGNQN